MSVDPYAGIGVADDYAGIAIPETAAPRARQVNYDILKSGDAKTAYAKGKASLAQQTARMMPQQRADAMRRYEADPRVQKLRQASQKHDLYNSTDLVLNKASLGLSDKFGAVVKAAIDKASGERGSFGDRYQQRQGEIDVARNTYKAENRTTDWLTLPANLAGLGAGAGGFGLKAVAKAGAIGGGISGAGASRGSLGDQALQTVASTAFGAAAAPAIGAALPAVLGGVGKGTSKVAQLIRRAPPPASTSGKVMLKTLADQGMTPNQASRMIADAQDNGVPMALMDTGDETRGLAAALSRKPGPTRKLLRDVAIPRQTGQGERIQGALNRDLGPTVGVSTESQRLSDSASRTAAPLYEKAYAAPLPDDQVIGELSKLPVMQDALTAGRALHAQDAALAKATGKPVPPPLPENGLDVRMLDYAKRALDRKIDAAYSGDAAAKMQLPHLKEVRAELLNRLDTVVPDFGAARAAYRGPKEMADALELGKSLVTKSGDEITAAMAGLTKAEIEQARLGFRSGLSDMVDSRVDGADKVAALVNSPKKRKALEQMFGGEKGMARFLDTLSGEGATAQTYGRINTGSPTAANLADDESLSGIGGVAANAGLRAVGGQGMTANAIMSVRDLVKYGAGKSGQRVVSELAAGLSETDPLAFREAIKGARRAAAFNRAGQRKSVPLSRFSKYAATVTAAKPIDALTE